MEYPKVCSHCENCKNSPYGEWYCVDEAGKIVKEIIDPHKETCKNYNLAEVCKRFIENMKEEN